MRSDKDKITFKAVNKKKEGELPSYFGKLFLTQVIWGFKKIQWEYWNTIYSLRNTALRIITT